MKQQANNIEWKEVELKELGDIGAGGTPSRTKPEYWGGTIPWLKISNLKEFYVTKYDETITENGLKNSSAKIFKKGTILISIFASLGDVAILDIDATTNQAIAGIYNLKENINREYLALYLKSLKEYFQKIGRGVAQNNLNLSILRSIKIILPFSNGKPDLKEQERIVLILEKAEKVKAKGNNAGKLLDEYLKSVFNEMFGNPIRNNKKWGKDILKNVCDKVTDGEHATPELVSQGIPYISAKNINEKIDFENVKYIDEETYKKITKRCLPEYGDILITCVGTIGRVKRIDIKDRFVFARSVALIKPKRSVVNNLFLEMMLSLPSMKKYMMGNTNEATVKGLYLKQINLLKIIIPPLPLQQKFAKIVEHIERLKKNVKKTKKNSEELLNSLMTKAFKGEL